MQQPMARTIRRLGPFLCLTFAAPAFPDAIEGFVEFHGTPPPSLKLRRESDRFCAEKAAIDPAVRISGNRVREKVVEVTVEPRQTTKVVFHYGQRLTGGSIH